MSRRGAFPSCFSVGRSADPFLCHSYNHRLGAVLSCWRRPRLRQPGLGSVPVLEGLPAQRHRRGWHGDKGVTPSRVRAGSALWPEACTPGRPSSCTPCAGALLPMGPAGFFHRVIKCPSPRGRQRQLPGLQIRGAKETGCAQGRETVRPHTCSPPSPSASLFREWGTSWST